jgi:ABC-2 type transport system permease protein
MRRLLVLLLLVGAAGCGPDLSGTALADGVSRTFANLYVRAQALQGRTDVTASGLGAVAVCLRGARSTTSSGPGDDWRCVIRFTDPSQGPREVLYEVVLKPDACYTADGPPAVVGALRMHDLEGRQVLNPIYAFDGCL